MMNSDYLYFTVFCFILTWPCCCAKIKLYMPNGRVLSGVTYTKTVRSLLECTILYEKSTGSKSFNYRRVTKSCELSNNYPESYTAMADGWKVYSNIVDGVWATWTNWGSCTATCGGGAWTRTRSCMNPAPSNGGAQCIGDSVMNAICNTHDCPVDGGWTNWSPCSATCGVGTKTRTKSCDDWDFCYITEVLVCNVLFC